MAGDRKQVRVGLTRHFFHIQEWVQGGLAFMVVLTTCVGTLLSFLRVVNTGFPPEWWTILGLVVGFYFGKVQFTTSKAEAETDK
jgi:hypothetical protein